MRQRKWTNQRRGCSHTPAICKWAPHSAQTVWPYSTPLTSQLTARKNYKQKLLKGNPEILFADSFKTGGFCNLIFFTDHPNVWHKAIINHYPSVKKEGICNGWKVKIREPYDPDITITTVNIYKNGTVMVQGNLKSFQTDYSTIMKQEKPLLPE